MALTRPLRPAVLAAERSGAQQRLGPFVPRQGARRYISVVICFAVPLRVTYFIMAHK